jgi:hypothetical protein
MSYDWKQDNLDSLVCGEKLHKYGTNSMGQFRLGVAREHGLALLQKDATFTFVSFKALTTKIL